MFGLGRQKPHHYREMLKIVWENRDELPFAWRILNDGVCDGCALGTSGLSDWTIDGPHLCMVRLELMRLNTAPALDPSQPGGCLERCPRARRRSCASSDGCRSRCCGAAASAAFASCRGTRPTTRWPSRLRAVDPARAAFYLTSRGITNEVYYAAQKAARFLGTNHVDNSARLCHAASTAGDEGDARLRRVDLQLRRLAARRSDRALRIERRQQPAGDDEVPAPREAERRADRRRQSVSRAGPRALLGAVDRRRARCSARRSPITGSTSTPAATSRSWSACCARSSNPAASTRRSCASARRASRRRASAALAADWAGARARERRDARSHAGVRAAARRAAERGVRLVDGADAARARRRDDQGADERRPRARPAGPPNRGLVPIRGHSGVQGGAEVGCVPALPAATAAALRRASGAFRSRAAPGGRRPR